MLLKVLKCASPKIVGLKLSCDLTIKLDKIFLTFLYFSLLIHKLYVVLPALYSFREN